MIKEILRSIVSLILINFRIFLNFSNKKVILFNFPREQVAKKDLDYIFDLFKNLENDFLIFFVHKITDNTKKKNNLYFMNQYFLKFIFFVNYFFSNYISDFFPFSSKNIYIHHCITDSPLTDIRKNNEIASRFNKYDFILINSIFVKKYFEDIIDKYSKKSKLKKITKVIDVGYPRIDYLFKEINKIKTLQKKNSIIIAPANFIAFKNFTLLSYLEFIVDKLLKYFNFNIIFRPHPQNRKNFYKFKFLKKYKNEKRFLIDTSDNYLNNYYNTKFMISDLSGTAFTYSFLTENPVLFFLKNEKIYKKNYRKFEHFKLRNKIGLVCSEKKKFVKYIKKLIKNKKVFKNKIKYEKQRLTNLSNAKDNIHTLIKNNFNLC